jgi:hypothetical protein
MPQLPPRVVSVNPDPEDVAVNVAGVCADHIPEVSTPPREPPFAMSAVRVDLFGTEPGAWGGYSAGGIDCTWRMRTLVGLPP